MCLKDLRTYLSADGQPAFKVAALLRAYGIDAFNAPDDSLIPIDACWRLFTEHAALVGDEMHCAFGTRLKPGGTNLLIASMVLTENIHEAMCAYAAASEVVAPDLKVTVSRRPTGLSLKWAACDPGNPLHEMVLEGQAAIYFAIFSWLAEDTLPVLRVRAPADRRNSASTLLQAMAAPVVHAGQDLEVIFAPQVACAPIRRRDIGGWRDGVHRILSTIALGSGSDRPSHAFSHKVRSALLDGVDQQSMAHTWGVSTKTIARRLEQEGVSFRRIRDEVRMEKSTCLIHAGLTVERIGDELGYEDARSFRRAFHRWFGVSPSAYRVQRQAI
jgi:AraC-like DNA-binding protein